MNIKNENTQKQCEGTFVRVFDFQNLFQSRSVARLKLNYELKNNEILPVFMFFYLQTLQKKQTASIFQIKTASLNVE